MTPPLEQLAHRPVGRLLWQYSLPAIVGMVVMATYNIVDRVYIGHGIDAKAIAGLAVTFPVMNIATALGVLIGAGASARISIHLGAGHHEKAQLTLGNALILTVVIGITYITLFSLFLDPILFAFGASPSTIPYAHDYMAWLMPGLLLTNLAFSFNNIQRASGYPKRAMWTMIIGALTNIALTPLFIFVFGMGIKGAALSTDIAMLVTFLYVMRHFLNPRSTLHFRRNSIRFDMAATLAIVTIGAAPALVNAAASLINMLINTTLLRYGSDDAIAAAGIFSTYTGLIVMIIIAICQGMQPITGYNYGAHQLHRLRRTYLLATAAATALSVIGCAVALTWPEMIARVFTSDETLIEHTRTALRYATVAFFLVGYQIVASNFFQSIGLAVQSIILSLSRQVIFLIPLLIILPDHYGLRGTWMSFPISDILATIVTAIMVTRRFRIIARTPSPTAP